MLHFIPRLALIFLLAGIPYTAFSQNVDSTFKSDQTDATPQQKMPRRKTDIQIRQEDAHFELDMQTLPEKQKPDYIRKVFEDRVILTMSDFDILEMSSGVKICSMQAHISNFTSRQLYKIHIDYSWNDRGTYIEFASLPPFSSATESITLSGSVCSHVLKGANYKVTTCELEGLTEEQCRLRIVPIK